MQEEVRVDYSRFLLIGLRSGFLEDIMMGLNIPGENWTRPPSMMATYPRRCCMPEA